MKMTTLFKNSVNRCSVFLFGLALICAAICQSAKAVSPPPDGGYPGGNTAEGQNALLGLTNGTYNTAVGFLSLGSNSAGSFNTAIGAGALLLNVGDQSTGQGTDNTGIGAGALLSNTVGRGNTANGAFALFSNTFGETNTATGARALLSNTYGGSNCAFGRGTLENNTNGDGNVAVGETALYSNIEGYNNVAVGYQSLLANTIGNNDIAIGFWCLRSNSEGSENVAIGDSALFSATGSNNSAFGAFAGSNVGIANNVICIGTAGADVDDSCFIGNIYGTTTANDNAIPVLIDSAGQLGTASSSRRYKTDIKGIDKASESIFALKPVSFHYKLHKDGRPQFGLVAEEVAEVNPNLVIYDRDGKPYTVRYDAVNAMLLNEFLKEHKTVQEQGATIARLESQIEALTAGLQKVSAQIEANKSTPRVVLNNH